MRDQSNRVSSAHLSLKDWKEIILDWQSSGQSQQDYCHKNGLTIGSFGYWRKKTHQFNQDVHYKKESLQPTFSALEIIPTTKEKVEFENSLNACSAKIQLSNGVLIKIPNTAEKELLSFVFSMKAR